MTWWPRWPLSSSRREGMPHWRRASMPHGSRSTRGSASARAVEHNLALLARQRDLLALGQPLLVGWSRKSTLGTVTGRPVGERQAASVAAALMAVERGARIVRVHDVAATVRCDEAVVRGESERREDNTMSQRRYFGTDGIRGTVGQSPDHARLHAAPGPCGRPRAAPRCKAAGRADRQGHTHLGLHDRVGAGGRVRVRRRRRSAVGTAAHAGRGLSDARAAPGPGRGDQAPRTTRSTTTASSSSRHRARSCPTPGNWRSRAALDEAPAWADSNSIGKARRVDDASGRYVEFCKSSFASDLSLKGMKLVVDAAHGAAYHVAPDVFHELGAEVVKIGCAPDGLNINAGVGATSPQGPGPGRGRAPG